MTPTEQALNSAQVREALNARARLILPRAVRVAATAGASQLAARLTTESGTRPGTKATGGMRRPYARVMADMPQDARVADAGAKLTPRAVLRRASSG